MLTPLELRVVKDHKIHGFVAFLQGMYFRFGKLEIELPRKKYPSREFLIETLDKIDKRKGDFDFEYAELAQEEVNPLVLEQQGWELLSPRIGRYVQCSRQFVDAYTPEQVNEETAEQLRILSRDGFGLIKKWNILSRSFDGKYELAIYGVTDLRLRTAEESANTLRALIEELSSPVR